MWEYYDESWGCEDVEWIDVARWRSIANTVINSRASWKARILGSWATINSQEGLCIMESVFIWLWWLLINQRGQLRQILYGPRSQTHTQMLHEVFLYRKNNKQKENINSLSLSLSLCHVKLQKSVLLEIMHRNGLLSGVIIRLQFSLTYVHRLKHVKNVNSIVI
jgi:hypothetical protein